MFRPSKSLSESRRQRDWFGLSLISIGILISCWIVSMLFVQNTRKLTIRRFHLASPSFFSWAALAPVPSMYNFENRIQFRNRLESSPLAEGFDFDSDSEDQAWFRCYVNHFPARCMTFGEFAPQWFENEKQGTFEMSTRYRETELVSRWEVTQQSDGTMVVNRVSEDWVNHNAGD